METAVRNFLLDVPHAAGIWVILLAIAMLALALLSVAPGGARSRRSETLRAEAQEAHRYAAEIAVAATGASANAERHRAEWAAAQDAVDAAWRAYEAADAAARRAAAGAAFRSPTTDRTPAEFAERERYLHRAATAACRRKELSVRVLSDVLAHRNGWDPSRHPLQQQVHLARAIRSHLLATYQAAAEAERAAWHAAEVASAATRSLRDEAAAAAEAASRTAPWLPTAEHKRGPVTAGLHRPRLATR